MIRFASTPSWPAPLVASPPPVRRHGLEPSPAARDWPRGHGRRALSLRSSRLVRWLAAAAVGCVFALTGPRLLPTLAWTDPTPAVAPFDADFVLPKSVTLELAAEDGWLPESATAPVVSRFAHGASGAVAQVLVVHGSLADPDEGQAAMAIVRDWDERFRLDDPRVRVTRHGEESIGELRGIAAELVFEGRAGWYFGVAARSISSADEDDARMVPRAFFVLCEGPSEDGTLPAPCSAVATGLRVRL